MKTLNRLYKIILITIFFTNPTIAKSQSKFLNNKPIIISYWGHFAFHPGIKIGTKHHYKRYKGKKKDKQKSYFLSPQLGFYTHPKNHQGVLFNNDFGYQSQNKKGFYHSYSVGLAYALQMNAGTT
jgi:hypothetical protein